MFKTSLVGFAEETSGHLGVRVIQIVYPHKVHLSVNIQLVDVIVITLSTIFYVFRWFLNAIFRWKNIKATTIYELTTTFIPTNIVK